MVHLIQKYFRVNTLTFVKFGALTVVNMWFALVQTHYPDGFLVQAVAMMCVTLMVVTLADKREPNEQLIGSLPVKRANVVWAHYVSAYIIMVGGLGLWLAYAWLFDTLFPEASTDWLDVLTFKVIATYFFLVSVFISIFFPSSFRNEGRSKALKGAIISFGLFLITINIIIEVLAAQNVSFENLVGSVGRPIFTGLLMLAVLLLVAGSGVISVRFFREREL